MTPATVRLAGPEDLDALARLGHAMERHYEDAAAIPIETVRTRFTAALFGRHPAAEALLAEHDGDTEGFALFTTFFPARDLTTGLFLKDLFVAPAARRRGVGRRLLAGLARLATERGHDRIDWMTGSDASTAAARAAYDAAGAKRLPGAIVYRLADDALARLAADG